MTPRLPRPQMSAQSATAATAPTADIHITGMMASGNCPTYSANPPQPTPAEHAHHAHRQHGHHPHGRHAQPERDPSRDASVVLPDFINETPACSLAIQAVNNNQMYTFAVGCSQESVQRDQACILRPVGDAYVQGILSLSPFEGANVQTLDNPHDTLLTQILSDLHLNTAEFAQTQQNFRTLTTSLYNCWQPTAAEAALYLHLLNFVAFARLDDQNQSQNQNFFNLLSRLPLESLRRLKTALHHRSSTGVEDGLADLSRLIQFHDQFPEYAERVFLLDNVIDTLIMIKDEHYTFDGPNTFNFIYDLYKQTYHINQSASSHAGLASETRIPVPATEVVTALIHLLEQKSAQVPYSHSLFDTAGHALFDHQSLNLRLQSVLQHLRYLQMNATEAFNLSFSRALSSPAQSFAARYDREEILSNAELNQFSRPTSANTASQPDRSFLRPSENNILMREAIREIAGSFILQNREGQNRLVLDAVHANSLLRHLQSLKQNASANIHDRQAYFARVAVLRTLLPRGSESRSQIDELFIDGQSHQSASVSVEAQNNLTAEVFSTFTVPVTPLSTNHSVRNMLLVAGGLTLAGVVVGVTCAASNICSGPEIIIPSRSGSAVDPTTVNGMNRGSTTEGRAP